MTSEEGAEKATKSIKNIFDPQTVLFQKTNTDTKKKLQLWSHSNNTMKYVLNCSAVLSDYYL